MKKIMLILLSVLIIVSLCACGNKTEQTATANATPATVVDVQSTPVPDAASNYYGTWYIDAEKSGTDKLYVLFGNSVHDYGGQLNIAENAVNFFIGATGGDGTYTFADGVFKADIVDYNEKKSQSYEIKVFNESSSVYLTQEFPDGDGIYTVYWTKTAPQQSAGATPTPQVVYVVPDPNETQTPATATPQIVYVVEEPKTETAATTVTEVYLKTLSTFESQYSSVISKYQKAISEKWSVDDCYSNEVNYLVSVLYSQGMSDRIGYCYGDVDGNGIDELIIGVDNQIYAMYTLSNNQPVQVVDAGERSAYYLEPDGVIVNRGSGSAFLSAYTFYHLEGSKLVVNNALVSDFSANEQNPWFYAEDDDWDVSNDTKLSTEKAEQWIKAYEDNYITFPYIPLVTG